MTAFNADNASIAYIPNQFSDAGGQRQLTCRNSEVWFRIFGDSLTCEYRAAGDSPLWISVDGGAWSLIVGAFVNTGAGTATSGEMLPGGTSDAAHDIRLRLTNGFTGGFRFVIANGIIVTSTGGVPDLSVHSEFGSHQPIRGAHGTSFWSDSFSGDNHPLGSGYSSPIFPAAKPAIGTSQTHECYCRFLVDGATTKLFPTIAFNGSGTWRFSIWVDGILLGKYSSADALSAFLGTTLFSVPIPGSGTREIVLCNTQGLYGITVDGGFVSTAVTQPAIKAIAIGDSVTSADSNSNDFHAITWFMQDFILRDSWKYKNVGLSGDTAVACTTANRVDNDMAPFGPDIVICNYGINDASRWNSVPATVQAEYEALFNDILATFPAAILYAIPPVESTTGFYADVRTGIQSAVTAVGDARCIFIDSAGWDVDLPLRSGAHPTSLGYGQGYGSAVVEINSQPADGDTVTIDGIVYEFDNNASVTGGNILVTIGADREATARNLSAAIQGQGGSVLIEHVNGVDNAGLVLPGVASISRVASTIEVYLEADGWVSAFDVIFFTDTAPPVLQSATVSVDGTTTTLVFDENVTGQTGFTITASGGAVTLAPSSGDGTTTHVFTNSRVVNSGEVVTLDYDSGTGTSVDDEGNALASFSSFSVTNNSTQVGSSPESVPGAVYRFAALRNTLRQRSQNCNDPRLTESQRLECRRRQQRISRNG